MGGFDGTSNVLAGKLTGIDVKGTHAHAYIMCYTSLSELHETTIGISHIYNIICIIFVYRSHMSISYQNSFVISFIFPIICPLIIIILIAPSSGEGSPIEFLELVLQKRKVLGFMSTNEGELAAFISYAQAFPRGLLALVDTYDTVQRYYTMLCYHT